ncbi:Thaumatin family protein [Lentzea waywayandensis]|uniref:Thaumatin family protein n=1 Tax=Lentzea waywayandensis TaxID=84724 RepID=A0A1I6FG03_9PSEU|nr:thaumatin family protein [Lentzea waywayandensis]SFR28707.1 Thaumatin family protein [Lentzea waywayandensis]
MRTQLRPLWIVLLLALAGSLVAAPASAAPPYTVKLVNRTGGPVWVGSGVNEGSVKIGELPKLEAGESVSVHIPLGQKNEWSGKFFARQHCKGEPGSTFHCLVGDCGARPSHCTTGEQPASLAEFTFAPRDEPAPWYNVSYVNGVNVPITINPTNGPPPNGQFCGTAGCPGALLPACPDANLRRHPETGKPMLCVNPNRDAQTPYSNAIARACPKAYSWSKHDTEPGNRTMFSCRDCNKLTVTFH